MDKKLKRILNLYDRFRDGEVIVKKAEAEKFGVNVRTIRRDIDDLKGYFAENSSGTQDLIYDRNQKGYVLIKKKNKG